MCGQVPSGNLIYQLCLMCNVASMPSSSPSCMQPVSVLLCAKPIGQFFFLGPPKQDDTREMASILVSIPWLLSGHCGCQGGPVRSCSGSVRLTGALRALTSALESTGVYRSLQQLQGPWGWLFFLTVGQWQKGPTWRNSQQKKPPNQPTMPQPLALFLGPILFNSNLRNSSHSLSMSHVAEPSAVCKMVSPTHDF